MDPVSKFQSEYKKRFHAYVEDFLARAIKKSKIDVRENAKLAKRIRHKTHTIETAKQGRVWRIALLILFCVVGGIATAVLYHETFPQPQTWFLILYWVASAGLIFFKLIPDLFRLGRQIETLTAALKALTNEALEKLRPFYRQFSWDTLTNLIERTLPEIHFDPYLTDARMNEFQERFGLNFAELMENKSMLYTHSGTFFGYPFLFYNTRCFHWGEETYTGTKFITWTTRERGPDGKMQTRFHSQTLVAGVTKPCPRFCEEKRLLFAHPAAPNLSFSRKPSPLSGKQGFFHGIRKRSTLRKLKTFESNLTDESNYTMVANQEFELLFETMNRDHEVEFRMLFTPVAQQQMVTLLNDTKVGYGDDLFYLKQGPITLLSPEHLNHLPFSTEPTVLPYYDFKDVLKFYFTRYEEFFRSLYFSLAPLYTIPSYQVPAPREEESPAPGVSSWEFEAIANWAGADVYAHPESCTENLYRVDGVEHSSGNTTALLTAIGFRGTNRQELVSVLGRDGRTHLVSVPWIEYSEVHQRSFITAHADRSTLPEGSDVSLRRGLFISKL